MLTATIGQISAATTLHGTTYLEAEVGGVSKRTTLQMLANYCIPSGTLIETAYEKTVSETFPAVPLYDSDHTVSESNYPILVPELRAAVASVTLTAGTVVTSIDVNATAGSILSSVNSAFTIIAAAIVEEYAVQGAYDIAVTIGGTEYAITSASSTLTISGTIATGATTMSVCPHRIVGSDTTAKVFKDSGRAALSHDGKTYLAGFRRRDRMQGHTHGEFMTSGDGNGADEYTSNDGTGGGPSVSGKRYTSGSTTPNTGTQLLTGSPYTDGTNGTPRTGATTDPNSNVVYRWLWAQEYAP